VMQWGRSYTAIGFEVFTVAASEMPPPAPAHFRSGPLPLRPRLRLGQPRSPFSADGQPLILASQDKGHPSRT